MRVVFMGTPDFAVGVLDKIIEKGHEVVAVVTQPDKPKGRGKEVSMPPVKEVALKYSIPVLQPIKVREPEVVEQLKGYNPDVIVVVAFGQILTQDILDIPKFGCVNVHASLLPQYRGAAPIQWAVIDGLEETGVTTQQMNKGLDTGDILMVGKLKLDKDETGGSLFDRLCVLGAQVLVDTLDGLEAGTITPVPQDDSKSTYAKKLDKSMGNIERLIRGLNPWPGSYTFMNGKQLKIWKCEIVDDNKGAAPGTIIAVDKDSFSVACGAQGLKIMEIQMEGKKRMDTGSFLRGVKVDTETVLSQDR